MAGFHRGHTSRSRISYEESRKPETARLCRRADRLSKPSPAARGVNSREWKAWTPSFTLRPRRARAIPRDDTPRSRGGALLLLTERGDERPCGAPVTKAGRLANPAPGRGVSWLARAWLPCGTSHGRAVTCACEVRLTQEARAA